MVMRLSELRRLRSYPRHILEDMLSSRSATSIQTRCTYICQRCSFQEKGARRWKGSLAPNNQKEDEDESPRHSPRAVGVSHHERQSHAFPLHHDGPSRQSGHTTHFGPPTIRKHFVASPEAPAPSHSTTFVKEQSLRADGKGGRPSNGNNHLRSHQAKVVHPSPATSPPKKVRDTSVVDFPPLTEFELTFNKRFSKQSRDVVLHGSGGPTATVGISRTQIRQTHSLTITRNGNNASRGERRHVEDLRKTGIGSRNATTSQWPPPTPDRKWRPHEHFGGIRSQLREWQELNGQSRLEADALEDDDSVNVPVDVPINNALRASFPAAAILAQRRLRMESQADEISAYGADTSWDSSGDSLAEDPYTFRPGDLVDIETNGAQRASEAAVFVRRVGQLAQLLTFRGQWTHSEPRFIRFVVPGWIPGEMLQSIVDFMPKPEKVSGGIQGLRQEAYIKDMSIPRSVSGDVVDKLQQFTNNVNDVYRQHVHALDNAHSILAHETNLRHGTLKSVAATLLQTDESSLSGTQLCAVFRAIRRGGYGFEMDRLAYRVTGQLQIRSKELVKGVEHVRNWVRHYQEEISRQSSGKPGSKSRSSTQGAAYVSDFVEKARRIILLSREDREATPAGLGISRHRFALEPGAKSVRMICGTEFNDHDREILRFLEHWALGRIIDSSPEFTAYPPMILHATNLYDDWKLTQTEGLVFLQELGTVLPYESRVRFSQDLLLLDTADNSLKALREQTKAMERNPNFVDEMAHLRHDWKDLSAYAIDSAGALEIDDAISIEPGPDESDGRRTYWIHVHVANPTAFFARDHPVAKVAQHMGETVYLPEEPYRMLPEWVSHSHFSLGNDRPCLTFSTRVDDDATPIERVIRPGVIRRHVSVTYDEVDAAIGGNTDCDRMTVLTVGGEPPVKTHDQRTSVLSDDQLEELRLLNRLALRRRQQRVAAGAIVFQTPHLSIKAWDSYDGPGVDLDEPYERGSRRVEGDPVVSLKAERLKNWFAAHDFAANDMVAETMMLAGESVAKWCEERHIPALFRVTTTNPDSIQPNKFYNQHLAPILDAGVKEIPLHLGWQYISTFGRVNLTTTPSKQSIMGVDRYCKVTSPLRRYGDMIQHWQIEAALREEAQRGTSLVGESSGADRAFLPYATEMLGTIGLALQARERLIRRSSTQAHNFWTMHLLNRARPSLPQSFHVSLYSVPDVIDIHVPVMGAIAVDLGIQVSMDWPQKHGLPIPRAGDVWEVEFEEINPLLRRCVVKPVRLAKRVGDDGWIGWVGDGGDLDRPEPAVISSP